MTAQARKFTFDLDLATGRRAAEPPAPTLEQAQADAMIAVAREEGYRRGLAEGAATAEARATDALTKAAKALAAQAGTYVETLETRRAELLSETTGLSLSIGRKLASHLLARCPEGELEALLADALGSLDHAPHLVIRCHPDLTDILRTAAEARMKISGFSGRLVVMGDPEIGLSDGRLEWVDGGLVRDRAAIERTIEDKIAAYLTAQGATGQQTRQEEMS